MKWGMLSAFSVSMLLGGTACGSDDPDYSDVTPPVVASVASTIGGIVSDKSGDVIAGATVTMTDSNAGTKTVQTDADGIYLFEEVQPGAYSLTVEAEGKQTAEGNVTVEDAEVMQRYIWNVALAADLVEHIAVSATETTSASVTTETLNGNEVAAVNITTVVPANAVSDVAQGEEVVIDMRPVYSIAGAERSAALGTKASAETLLTGSELKCNVEGATLNEPMELRMDVGDQLVSGAEVRRYKDGQWSAAKWTKDGDEIVVEADEFATYGVFVNIDYTLQEKNDPISFTQSIWDNLYGAQDVNVTSVPYSFKAGTEVTTSASDKLTGLLVEKLAQLYAAANTTVDREYPVNVTLPVGTKLEISATQKVITATISTLGSSATITNYSDVSINVTTSNRQHTGGGSL